MKLRDLTNTLCNATTPKSRAPVRFRKPKQGAIQEEEPSITQYFPSRKRAAIAEPIYPREQSGGKRRKEALLLDYEDEDIPACVRSLHRVQSFNLLQSSNHWDDSLGSPDVLEHYSLKIVEKPQIVHKAFKSISGDTLCQLLKSLSKEQFYRKFILIDCRYPYEYNGGHIKHAINMFDVGKVDELFYPADEGMFAAINSRVPIFYCEFSQKRGPAMACELRRSDRKRNEQSYPQIDYKEIYLVDQGYRKFFAEDGFTDFCQPQGYTPMMHPNYIAELKNYRFHHKGPSSQSTHLCRSKQGIMPLSYHSSLDDLSVASRVNCAVSKKLFDSPSTPESVVQSESAMKQSAMDQVSSEDKVLSKPGQIRGQSPPFVAISKRPFRCPSQLVSVLEEPPSGNADISSCNVDSISLASLSSLSSFAFDEEPGNQDA